MTTTMPTAAARKLASDRLSQALYVQGVPGVRPSLAHAAWKRAEEAAFQVGSHTLANRCAERVAHWARLAIDARMTEILASR